MLLLLLLGGNRAVVEPNAAVIQRKVVDPSIGKGRDVIRCHRRSLVVTDCLRRCFGREAALMTDSHRLC